MSERERERAGRERQRESKIGGGGQKEESGEKESIEERAEAECCWMVTGENILCSIRFFKMLFFFCDLNNFSGSSYHFRVCIVPCVPSPHPWEIKVEIMVSFRHDIYFASGDREQQSSASEWEKRL